MATSINKSTKPKSGKEAIKKRKGKRVRQSFHDSLYDSNYVPEVKKAPIENTPAPAEVVQAPEIIQPQEISPPPEIPQPLPAPPVAEVIPPVVEVIPPVAEVAAPVIQSGLGVGTWAAIGAGAVVVGAVALGGSKGEDAAP
ncbi:MAG: hypothetical protein ORN28_07360, partial [Rhodoferax sp.]|nr:hypothetical protein [Rhodoferax sp.]